MQLQKKTLLKLILVIISYNFSFLQKKDLNCSVKLECTAALFCASKPNLIKLINVKKLCRNKINK